MKTTLYKEETHTLSDTQWSTQAHEDVWTKINTGSVFMNWTIDRTTYESYTLFKCNTAQTLKDTTF